MPLSPRVAAVSSPNGENTNASLVEASVSKPLKSVRKRKRSVNATDEALDSAAPLETSSKPVCHDAVQQEDIPTHRKRRVKAAKGAKQSVKLASAVTEHVFNSTTPTPEHLLVSKAAKLFADIVPGIEEAVPALVLSDKRQPASAQTSSTKSGDTVAKLLPACAPATTAASPTSEASSEIKVKKVKKKVPKRKSNLAASSSSDNLKEPLQSLLPEDATKQEGAKDVTPTPLGTEAFRKAHEIVVPKSCAAPLETFKACETGFGAPLIAALRLQGYTAPTPIQAQAWPIALQGLDMVAVAKTGSGKTCGFLLPALAGLRQAGQTVVPEKGSPALPRVLVLAPTRELAQQIAGEADKFKHVTQSRVVAVYGGVPKGDQVHELQLGADVVVATTGRLLDFSAGCPEKQQCPLVSMKRVSYLVLDEADRMLDMGFEPDIRKIVSECPQCRPRGEYCGLDLSGSVRQTLFFTATWPKAVQRTAASLTSPDAVQLRIGQGRVDGDKLTANTNVTQKVFLIDEKQKLTYLNDILKTELGPGESAFVFAKTRHTCDYLEQKLWDEKEDLMIGTWCRAIHSHKEQWVRDESLATFRNITTGKDNGRKGILVATDVAARGLDIPGVALVIVYDFGGGNLGENSGVESYVHRIGRTGRAGKKGKAFTFFTEHDSGAKSFVKLLDDGEQRVPYELRALAEKRSGGKAGKGGGGKGGGKGSKGGKGGKCGKGKGKSKSGKGATGKGGTSGKGKAKGGKW